MNKEKREGIERIGNTIGSIVTLDMQTKEKLAKALWNAGIRDASGFYVETAFPFSITFDNREKMNNRIKPKVYEVENINKNRA